MFDELLTSIGFGNAKVDTLVKQTTFHPEDKIAGVVQLFNLTEQDIERIELTLIERKENTDETSDFHTIDLPVSKVILQHDGTGEVPFIFDTHEAIEDYINHEFFIMTHVFVDNAVDYYDEDQIYFKSEVTR
ncbi:sporulation protein [Macrococcoides caseolyticum]|uniref:sporulation protein n=1 Tax=Macrococcoides caseolyticum TaxID=69966 RepID=UPI001F157832|nr:sporulation protein [Macrococcus caseolyticus]MCE4957133.1 sporulation protein [Macrococcus caseolyticus]